MTYRGAGVYLFRTRRPGLIGRLPGWVAPVLLLLWSAFSIFTGEPLWEGAPLLLLISRQNAYVGESLVVRKRRDEHLDGGGRFYAPPKPWSDLDPSWYFIPLPRWKPLLLLVERLAILLLWPVYNHGGNLWNPRRTPLRSAASQREQRDRVGWSFNIRPVHALHWIGVILYLRIVLG